jgi:SAM-dependent methyltransferase
MKKHKYKNEKEYLEIQTLWNKRKISSVWVSDASLDIVADEVKSINGLKFGICHGTRRGVEQARLRELLGIEVIGTEISDTATQFQNTIQWDFHNVRPEWIGAVDFIYSNSLDHSHSPDIALKKWVSCLKPGGLCFIDWSSDHNDKHVNDLDCFGASESEMEEFLKSYGLVTKRRVQDRHSDHCIFIVQKL